MGSPVAASSLLHSHSRRGKRTLSAPMRDSMKRAEGSNNQQDQQQAVHQQQLEYKLLQLQQQQAQQAQQADAHHENNGITGPSDHRPSTPPTHPRPPLHPRNSGPAPHAPLSPMHQQQPHTQQPPSIPTCLPLHTFPPVRPPSPSLNNPQSAPTLYTFLEESLSPTLHPLQQANAVHSSPQQHPTAPSLPGAFILLLCKMLALCCCSTAALVGGNGCVIINQSYPCPSEPYSRNCTFAFTPPQVQEAVLTAVGWPPLIVNSAPLALVITTTTRITGRQATRPCHRP